MGLVVRGTSTDTHILMLHGGMIPCVSRLVYCTFIGVTPNAAVAGVINKSNTHIQTHTQEGRKEGTLLTAVLATTYIRL